MTGRYELSNHQWASIEDIISPPQRMGRPYRNDREMLNGLLWILCWAVAGVIWVSSSTCSVMPEGFH